MSIKFALSDDAKVISVFGLVGKNLLWVNPLSKQLIAEGCEVVNFKSQPMIASNYVDITATLRHGDCGGSVVHHHHFYMDGAGQMDSVPETMKVLSTISHSTVRVPNRAQHYWCGTLIYGENINFTTDLIFYPDGTLAMADGRRLPDNYYSLSSAVIMSPSSAFKSVEIVIPKPKKKPMTEPPMDDETKVDIPKCDASPERPRELATMRRCHLALMLLFALLVAIYYFSRHFTH